MNNPWVFSFEENVSSIERIERIDEAWKVSKLMDLWGKHLINGNGKNMSNDSSIVPPAPHIADCEDLEAMYEQFDERNLFGERPKWPFWKGHLQWHSSWNENNDIENEELLLGNNERLIMGPYPPWVFSLRLYVILFYFCRNISEFYNVSLFLSLCLFFFCRLKELMKTIYL